MLHLSKQLLQQCFLNIGYSPLDYIYTDEIQKAINQLNEQQFDKQTFQQMLDQCKNNSKGQIKVEDFIMTFIKAQNILVQRQIQLRNLITKLQTDIKQKRLTSNFDSNNDARKLEQQLEEVKQERVSNNINLQIIRKPFVNKRNILTNQGVNAAPPPHRYQSINRDQQIQLPGQGIFFIANTQTFTWIFQLTCFLLALSLPCMLYHNNFVNIVLFSFILLNFVTGYFCKNILRKWMYFTLLSIAIDIIWFIIGIKPYWIYSYVDFPHAINPYLRLTVILYGVICAGKLILTILLASEYNTDESQKKKVSVFGFFDIQLSHDQPSKTMFAVLNKPSHHHQLNQESHQ